MVTQEELQSEACGGLLYQPDLETSTRALEVAIDAALATLGALRNHKATMYQADAHHLVQIILVRSVSILQLARGISHNNNTYPPLSLGHIHDPASVWGLVRSQFEAVAVVNNIFLKHAGEEQVFLHTLWKIAGLSTRQRLRGPMNDPEVVEQLSDELLRRPEEELEALMRLIEVLKATKIYQALTPAKKKEIEKAIERRDYQYVFVNGSPQHASWQKLFKRAVAHDVFDVMYPYLCSWAHPSFVSVMQFEVMYSGGHEDDAVRTAVNFASLLLALTIHDQMAIAPESRQGFEALPVGTRSLLNFWNNALR